jgi:Family of unknown function (DUF6526)
MINQNYQNHRRMVPGFHYFTSFLILILLGGALVNLYRSAEDPGNLYSASLIALIPIILGLMFWYLRAFALRAQDRAIRAEENFRHFMVTGKPLDKRLHIRQIIALRFASDEELNALAQKAVTDNMTAEDIKKAIQHWKGDYHRV